MWNVILETKSIVYSIYILKSSVYYTLPYYTQSTYNLIFELKSYL